MTVEYLGNEDLLKVPKTAFLASSTIPPDMVLKCYDWAYLAFYLLIRIFARQKEDIA